jgi:hypothetical protein
MSLNLTTTFVLRRPTLIRVWRSTGVPGTPLTSTWLPTVAPNADFTAEGSLRQ